MIVAAAKQALQKLGPVENVSRLLPSIFINEQTLARNEARKCLSVLVVTLETVSSIEEIQIELYRNISSQNDNLRDFKIFAFETINMLLNKSKNKIK